MRRKYSAGAWEVVIGGERVADNVWIPRVDICPEMEVILRMYEGDPTLEYPTEVAAEQEARKDAAITLEHYASILLKYAATAQHIAGKLRADCAKVESRKKGAS